MEILVSAPGALIGGGGGPGEDGGVRWAVGDVVGGG